MTSATSRGLMRAEEVRNLGATGSYDCPSPGLVPFWQDGSASAKGETMGRKYNVISGDGHLETPPDFVKFVPEKWKDRAPRLIRLPDGGGDAWMMEGMSEHLGDGLARELAE